MKIKSLKPTFYELGDCTVVLPFKMLQLLTLEISCGICSRHLKYISYALKRIKIIFVFLWHQVSLTM